MPIVRVEMWAGRTSEQKAQIAQAITEALVRIAGVRADEVIIIFQDILRENWAQGGKLGEASLRKPTKEKDSDISHP